MSSRPSILGADDHESSGNYTERLVLLSKHATIFLGFVAIVHLAATAFHEDSSQ